MAEDTPKNNLSMLPGIVPINIEEEMRTSYMEYAMSVIIGRALPDVRDGLKPVHRRVLYSMQEQGNHHNRPYRKSARIVGDVIGKYHPHGESAVYDTIVRMTQPFSMRGPLVDGQGNFGSMDGDAPAAMRYTEARMTRLAHQMMLDLAEGTVDFIPTYDESLEEPTSLPTRFPNLLVNGSTGIAVGMATNIPPHNLGEVLDAFLYFIEAGPNATLGGLMQHLPAPDFPTGGIIMGRSGILSAYQGGQGSIKLRARCAIEPLKGDREQIVVTEWPFMVNKAQQLERIAEMVREKRMEGIAEIRDESDRKGVRVVIEMKRGHIGEVVLNNLYRHSQLQTTVSVKMLAVVDGQPRVLSLLEVFAHFLDYRIQVIERRTRFRLARAEARAHIVEGLRLALKNLEELIEQIKAAANPAEARSALMTTFDFSEAQAREILEMRLARLTGLEQQKLEDEYAQLQRDIAHYRSLLANRQLVLDTIRDETQNLRQEHGKQARHTEVQVQTAELNEDDLIAVEPMVVTITHGGYIKRCPVNEYRTQQRGGKGKLGLTVKEADFVETVFVASTHDYLLIFTSIGKVYWKRVYEIPSASRTARGKAAVNLFPLESEERIVAYLNVDDLQGDQDLLMATANGIVKRSALEAFSNPRSKGVRAINIDSDDRLIAVALARGDEQVILATRQGKALRFAIEQTRTMGRVARGVIGIRLRKNDEVVGMAVSAPDGPPAASPDRVSEQGTLLAITARGYGKKTPIQDYRLASRATQGVLAMRLTKEKGEIVGILQLEEEEQQIIIITNTGRLIRLDLHSLRTLGRVTQGVRLIQLDDEEEVVSLAAVGTPPEDPVAEEEPHGSR